MTFEAFSSPEGRHRRRKDRTLVCDGPPKAVAVHVAFNGLGYVLNLGSLPRSMTAARKLVHRVMEAYDASPHGGMAYPATLRPMTREQAQTACNTGGVREYRGALWLTADHHLDHMTRVRALGQLACLAGMLPNNED